jgi:hypothetical protein
MNLSTEARVKWVFITAIIFYAINFAWSEGFNGGADSITHYQMSRYSWQHHYLLMDQWGKPVFTILFSPIAQLGFDAVVLANMILIFLGAWWTMGIARQLQIRRTWLVAFIMLWMPVVVGNAISGLTEMICALFLLRFIKLSLENKFAWAATVLGFMPFARSEGFVMVALALIFFAFTRRWKFIPWLLMGSIAFNILGYFITGKTLWIFQSNPYVNTTFDMYGHGTFYHFFLYALPLFGIAYLLWIMQTMVMIPKVAKILKSSSWSLNEQAWIWLIAGSSWGYFLAHTVLWWQGMWASLGLGRVMFVIAGPVSLMAVRSVEDITLQIKPMQRKILLTAIIVLTLAMPPTVRYFQLQEIMIFPELGEEERQNKRVAEYLQKNYKISQQKFFAAHPYFNLLLDLDPFATHQVETLNQLERAVKGDIIVWDGHFGPNEMKIPKERVDHDTTLTLLEVFRPERDFYTLNNYLYEIRLYQKN